MVHKVWIFQVLLTAAIIGLKETHLKQAPAAVNGKAITMANELVASLDAVDIGFDFDESDSGTGRGPTKEDLPHLSREEYDRMMEGDPNQIMQARMPVDFPGSHVPTKEDLPHLSREEYDRMMEGDPSQIMQARMPVDFPGSRGPTKEDLPHLSREEYDRMMEGDPSEIMQARIPVDVPAFEDFEDQGFTDSKGWTSQPQKYSLEKKLINPSGFENQEIVFPEKTEIVSQQKYRLEKSIIFPSESEGQPSVFTKTKFETNEKLISSGAAQDIYQYMTTESGMTNEVVSEKEKEHEPTKDDLPHLSQEEYNAAMAAMNNDPSNIEQMRMPVESPFASEKSSEATKDDLPHVSQEEYNAEMNNDPSNIEQMRMPEEFPFALEQKESSEPTKEDLPHVTQEEYNAAMNNDPSNIEQMRMPEEFPFSLEQKELFEPTKDDLPHVSQEEYNAEMNNDPSNIEQMRMPEEFPFALEQKESSEPTKEDLPHVTQEEYNAAMNNDPSNIEQMRMPEEFPFSLEQKVLSEPTKDDLPHVTQEEYNAEMNNDPSNIEQMRMPEEFPFSLQEKSSDPTKDDLPHVTQEEYNAAMNNDPSNIEQMRMPEEFPFDSNGEQKTADSVEPEIIISSITKDQKDDDDFDFDMAPPPASLKDQVTKEDDDEFDFDISRPAKDMGNPDSKPSQKPSGLTHTKEDLPHLSPAEYEAINQGGPDHIQQARVPVTFPFTRQNKEENDPHKTATAKVNGAPTLNGDIGTRPDPLASLVGQSVIPSAESEWENVQEITARFEEEGDKDKGTPAVEVTPYISYSEALRHLETSNMEQFKSQIKTSVSRSGFAALTHALFGPPKLSKDLHDERDLIFCIAACPFINEDAVHFRVLKSIYRKLTGSKFDPARFGGHWDQIGFQGNDPASDLRGTGFLGLLQLLHLVMDPRTFLLARDIYRLSHHETQNFPMAVMSINMTRIALQVTREGVFNKDFNKRRNVFPLFNDVYAACYAKMFTTWKQQHKTIADSGFVIKDIEALARKKPKVLLADLEKTLEQRRNLSGAGGAPETDEEPLKFQAVADFDEDED